jgi:MFS family permease
MELSRELESTPGVQVMLLPATWDTRFARWLSAIFSPPLVGTITMGAIAANSASPQAWAWLGVYLLMAVLGPVVYVLRLVRRGEVTDFDLRLREQRLRPYLFTALCLTVAAVVLLAGSAPHLMVVLAFAGAIKTTLLLLITLRWKISVHLASISGFVVVMLALAGTPGLLFTPLIPAVAWARIRLRRHNLAQTIAGALVGGGLLGIALYLAG